MPLKLMHKTMDIYAPAEQVWKVLLDETYIKQWYTAFGEGVEAKTDWKLGSKAVFTDPNGDGLVGRIIGHEPLEKIEIEYNGQIIKGVEDFTSESALNMKGAKESYLLESMDGGTKLVVNCQMDKNYHDMMAAMWDNALEQIKQLSEN